MSTKRKNRRNDYYEKNNIIFCLYVSLLLIPNTYIKMQMAKYSRMEILNMKISTNNKKEKEVVICGVYRNK